MAPPSTHHLECLIELLQSLASEGIEMESHQYDCAAFGNFALVLTKGHAKVRFTWDGKESILTIDFQKVQTKAETGTWQHDAYSSVPSAQDVFAEIGSEAKTMLL
jgi:hypothetical protein